MIRYLSRNDISLMVPSWDVMIGIVEETVKTLAVRDFTQPLKPYVRYRNQTNRVVAMPAFVGGPFDTLGIKWIASFPGNRENNLPRASSVTILNNSQTGLPVAILSSNELSGLRAAAVSGYLIKTMKDFLPMTPLTVGIIGFGLAGQLHAKMISSLLKGQIKELRAYDLSRPELIDDIPDIKFTTSWEEACLDTDISICCTTSPIRYIDKLPKAGSLHLNVSLRDYCSEIVMKSSVIIVDNWEEICREDTDIQRCATQFGLAKSQVISLPELISTNTRALIDKRKINPFEGGFISFHPMGLAVFDVAISQFFYKKAASENRGTLLPQ